jgi:predicted deacylase
VSDLAGADLVFDIHASNIFLTEIPQVRINELHKDTLLPLARRANVDLVWVHGASTVLESTLAYSLNAIGTPCLVVEMGVGMRLTGDYGQQLTTGILNTMKSLGMWDGEVLPVSTPIVADTQDEVIFLNARCSGMFMKTKCHGSRVKKGETVGYVFDPFEGQVLEYVNAEKSGLLFTIRDYPLVDEGSLMGRILVGGGGAR